jgi:HK97 family phage major capsid protein
MENKDEMKELIREMMEEKDQSEDKENKSQAKLEEKSVEASVGLDGLAEKLVELVQAKAGGSTEQADQFVKQNIYNPRDGLKSVGYPDYDELKNLSDDEKIVLYVKSLVDRVNPDEARIVNKFLSEGVAADGGNLVPTPLASEVFRLLPDMSVMRRIARTIPMTSLTLDLPTNTTDPVAYWVGENKTKTTTSAEFGQVQLKAFKLVARVPITHELIADATIDIVRFIIERFAEAIATEEDNAFFTGNGTTQPTGLEGQVTNSTAVGAAFNFDDINNLMYAVRQSVRRGPNTAFVGHQSVIQKIQQMKDGNNNYIWRIGGTLNDGQTGRLPDTIYGIPVYEQNDLNQDRLYFGDFSKYIIGDRQQLTVSTTDEGGDAWIRDHTDIKAVERVAGNVVLPGAFARLTGIMT